jgi:hypothetical protein
MARSQQSGSPPDVEKVLKEFIEQASHRQIVRAFGTSSPAAEIREMRKALTRLERRVEQLGTRVSGRPRRASGSRRGPGRPATHTVCTVEGCNNPHYAKGLCSRCYQRERRNEARTSTGGSKRASKKATKKTSKKKSTKKKSAKKSAHKSASKKVSKRTSKRRTTRKTGQRRL